VGTQRTSTVLFDLDDTLFDHTHSARAALSSLREEHPGFRAFPLEHLAALHRRILDRTHVKVLSGELSPEAARVSRFRELCDDCAVTDVDVTALTSRYRDAYQQARRPVPGALELLGALRSRVTIGVVTNNVVVEQQGKLRHLGMTELIDVLVVSEEARTKKPEPEIFTSRSIVAPRSRSRRSCSAIHGRSTSWVRARRGSGRCGSTATVAVRRR
jgi:putative hydrolase of the HAD superfamily